MSSIKGLIVKNISKTYGNTKVLNSVSFEVKPGEVVALLGENGAGKSALLETMAGGELHVHGGTAKAFGVDIFNASRFANFNFLSYAKQDEVLMDRMTPEEHIAFFCNFLEDMSEEEVTKTVERNLIEFNL